MHNMIVQKYEIWIQLCDTYMKLKRIFIISKLKKYCIMIYKKGEFHSVQYQT